MTGNKKARPLMAQETGQTETAAFSGAAASKTHCTSNPVAGQFEISDLLSSGQKNAIPLRHLKTITGFDGRTIRLMIQRERLAGVPILADNQTGYYLPATPEEQKQCARSMRNRAREIERSAQAIEAADFPQRFRERQSAATEQLRMEGM